MMLVANLGNLTRSSAVYQAQCDAPLQVGHRRCGCRSRRHVDHLRIKRCVSHGRVVLIVTLLPWPIPQCLKKRAPAQSVSLTSRNWRPARWPFQQRRGNRRLQATPPGCPRQVLLAQVRDCARCPFGRRLAPPCSVHGHVVDMYRPRQSGPASWQNACGRSS